jgi:membrane protein YdbS with pleckstrin-like domain
MIRRLRDLPIRSLVLVAAVLVAAVAAHAGAWYFISRHLRLSGALASILIAIVVVKHLGWIGGAYALLRKHRAARAMRP